MAIDLNKVQILGVNINTIIKEDAISALHQFIELREPVMICTPNTEMIIRAQVDGEFKRILNERSKLNLPDGFGLCWAAKFNTFKMLNIPVLRQIAIFFEWLFSIILIPIYPKFFHQPIKERISGSDFIEDIAQFAADNKLKIFLLGGAPTVAERTALMLQTKIYDLKIGGVYSGSSKNTEEIISQINKSRSDILLVAFGAPKQEKWLADNLSRIKCKISVGLGGTFDFISGVKARAPKWMQNSGLEWLFRLSCEPWRFKRQLALPKFLWLVLTNKLKKR